ncbi:hypothetical protein L6164_005493 [Bauhinia variegata]|uniref:Uncharacterized protein n=1 Tax=Bauhinia variegata TaxID=167791 RepID=A0ACB9PRG3_BAUVA|nr:hypothetical protein L6164_005493 [Bauhinia variegata]
MDHFENDGVPMLLDTRPQPSQEHEHSELQRQAASPQSASVSFPMINREPYERETTLLGHTGPLRSERKTLFVQMSGPLYVNHRTGNPFQQNTGVTVNIAAGSKSEQFCSFSGNNENDLQSNYAGRNEHLVRSGHLGMCNDPYCTICPTCFKDTQQRNSKASSIFDPKFHNALYDDAKSCARRFSSFLLSCVPGVMNPHTKVVQKWNKFFAISCLVAIFVDPLFFFVFSVLKDKICIDINRPMTISLVLLRSITDFVCLLNVLLQFRLAYVAPESRVVGAGALVDHPKKIALHYLQGFFLIDLLVVFPLPQIIIYIVLSKSVVSFGANNAKDVLRASILAQYIPRLFRSLPLLIGQSPSGFIFESAWENFFINLLTYMLSVHLVGSCWYLFGLQRVSQCLLDACHGALFPDCTKLIDCQHGRAERLQSDQWNWKTNTNANACLTENGFPYGIYVRAVNLSISSNVITRYIYSSFWGFQQISTLCGSLTPSYYVWEVIFSMAIIGLGLLLFALLIGNMQNFLQALGKRRLEMSLRRRDVEQWMRHRRLPHELRRRVREAERFCWAATRGVNEEILLENLPEDLQRDIRRHLFEFVKKVRIFSLIDEPILDAICERLRQKTYIKGSRIMYPGGLVEKMIFVVRGRLESVGEDGIRVSLTEGDVCGEELLTWCLEHSSVNKDGAKVKLPGQHLLSDRMVKCLTNVEAFSLRAADLQEVTSLFTRLLRNPRVQGAIRYESPYWRSYAAIRIQVAWRYRMRRRLSHYDS